MRVMKFPTLPEAAACKGAAHVWSLVLNLCFMLEQNSSVLTEPIVHLNCVLLAIPCWHLSTLMVLKPMTTSNSPTSLPKSTPQNANTPSPSSKLENFLNLYLFNRRIITLQHSEGFLPYINMNWLQVYMGPLHPEIPFHFPPHPIPPGCHRALALDASSIKLALVIYFMCSNNSLSLSIWESTLCFVCSYTWEVGRAEVTGISMKLPKDFDVY